ncbi:BnaC01g23530D [Brassica napus]|uniref:BnaC01g23530D protein n=1 Tax=Brassica napus TaxID=3708 RepID=A0A078FV83_BRANA|nr:BnaC01g23530D [Brassica napus]
MNSNSKSPVSGNLTARKPNGKDVVSSAEPVKRDGQTGVSIATDVSGDPKKTKPNGKAVVSSTEPIRRTEQTGGSCANAVSGDLIPKKSNGKAAVSSAGTIKHSGGSGVPSAKTDEVLFFKDVKFGPQEDEIDTYLPHIIAGSIYRFNKFYGSKSKIVYRVAEPDVTIFPEDRFRFYGYEEFEAASDVKGDLYYYVGHMKLVNEQTMNDSLVMNGHVMKLYLWDKAATDLCEKFKAHGNTPSVIMVTTVNPKRFGALSSLSSSRVFFDMDVQPTRDYLTYYLCNSTITQVAWFECTATIDDVVHGSAWYYIAYGWCKAKATKGPTTLMCKKCGKAEVAGVAEYLTKLSVYDNNDQAFFVLLSDAGRELTGKPASELVESYFEANENVGDDHVIPVPQALIGTIGQTHKFNVKVSKHNLEGKTQALTMGNREDGPSIENEEAADEVGKRSFDGIESGEAKRAKCDKTIPTRREMCASNNKKKEKKRKSPVHIEFLVWIITMNHQPHVSYSFSSDIEPAITDPDRQLTIKIKRINQTEINFSIRYSTTGNGHLTDDTADLVEHMLSYHDIYFPVSLSTHVRTCLSIRDFNPKATKMINLDVALIDQRNSRREPIPEEADKWILHNLSCPTCRDTEL